MKQDNTIGAIKLDSPDVSNTPHTPRPRTWSVGAALGAIGYGYVVVMIGFLYLPILVMALMSANASPLYELPFHFTTHWYQALAEDGGLKAAALRSIEIALWTTLLSTVLGVMASLAFFR